MAPRGIPTQAVEQRRRCAFFSRMLPGATGIDPGSARVVAMRRLQGGLLKPLAQYKREKYALELVPGAGVPAPCDEPRSSLIGATVNFPRPRGEI